MIYTRFGSLLAIIADCGVHKPEGFRLPVHLLRATRKQDGAELYCLAHQIRADQGVAEIHQAIAAAPKVTLGESELAAALNQ